MYNTTIALVLGITAALLLTIVVYAKIMPKRLDGQFYNPLAQKLHDFFHFKKLYLEEVLKFIYVLATIFDICYGAALLLGYTYEYTGKMPSGWTEKPTFGYGLLLLIVGPIVLRLAYEGLMMFVLLVKNTIEINNKLSAKTEAPETTEQTEK